MSAERRNPVRSSRANFLGKLSLLGRRRYGLSKPERDINERFRRDATDTRRPETSIFANRVKRRAIEHRAWVQ